MLALHRAHDGLLSIGPNVPNLRVRLECAQSGLGAGAVFHALLYEFGLLLAFLFFFGGFALSFLLELLGRLGIRGLGWRIGRCFSAVSSWLSSGSSALGSVSAVTVRATTGDFKIFFWNMRRWWAIAKSFATVLINPLPLGNGSGGRKSCKKGYQGEISTRFHSAPV